MEQFTRDLWEALREQIREQLGDSISDELFEAQIPPWERLPVEARREKVLMARDETLRLIDRAGYEVRKKV